MYHSALLLHRCTVESIAALMVISLSNLYRVGHQGVLHWQNTRMTICDQSRCTPVSPFKPAFAHTSHMRQTSTPLQEQAVSIPQYVGGRTYIVGRYVSTFSGACVSFKSAIPRGTLLSLPKLYMRVLAFRQCHRVRELERDIIRGRRPNRDHESL